ncbi:LOW QUALITY PROTEIN: uncharacterized protein LOC108093274 [Drosophila ficusphila]|uniref:LOW QUALITY PROTEIN: uncharacterized protein LOC108093274 n=1 Tax=Drosophila ficusphila TaxID=30025 RepID=UPI0007E6EFA5|nr:LOW QUALITY PROTEIN: uncharacterized protein LOC108093274 [Drosophila ficusphila]
MTSESKMIVLFLIGCVIMQTIIARPFDKFSREDDERLNEVSGEWFKKPILRLDRLFSSGEKPTESRKEVVRPTRSDKRETTESSKHAYSMITSMLGFVSSVINFGRSFVMDQ